MGQPLAAPDDGSALSRGWELGKAGAYSRLGSATEYLGSGLGIGALRDFGKGMRQSGDTESFLESLRQPAPTTWEDVKNKTGVLPTINAGLTYLGEGAGQSGPEMLAPLAATAVGTIFGGPVAGVGAGAATAFPSFFGGNVQRQEAEVAAGRKAEVDVASAVKSAIGQSALNAIGDKLLLGGFLKPGQKWLTRTALGGVEGAVTEAPTEIAQQILERKQAGLPLDSDDAIDEYINAGILGGVLGSGVRGTTAALGIGIEEAPPPPPATPPATPLATPPAGTPPPTRPAGATGPASVVGTTSIQSGNTATTTVTLNDGSTITVPGIHDKNSPVVQQAIKEYNTQKPPPPPATPPATPPGALTDEERAARDAWQEDLAGELIPRVDVLGTVAKLYTPPKPTAEAPKTPEKVTTPRSKRF